MSGPDIIAADHQPDVRSYQMASFDYLKPGDQVVIEGRNGRVVRTVDKVTKTQVVIGKSRYRRGDGRQVGAGAWTYDRLTPATPELIAAIKAENEARRLVNALHSLLQPGAARRLLDLPIENLRQAHALLTGGRTPPSSG